MEFKIKNMVFNAADIMLLLCGFLVCASGHQGAESIYSYGNYMIFGLLLLAVFLGKFPICTEMVVFLGLTFGAGILTIIFNVAANSPHFALSASLKSTLYYCMHAYCGFYIAYKKQDTDAVFKLLHGISALAGLIVVLQAVFYFAGIHLNRIPVVGNYLFHAVDTSRYFRPSAFFSEPSNVAKVVLLDLFCNLFRKRNFWRAGLNVLALILSTSSLGIVLGFVIFVIWAVTQRISNNQRVNVIAKVLLLTGSIYLLYWFLGYSGSNAIINRILGGATISQRTLRAFEIYGKLEPAEKIFGIGMQNLANYINVNSLVLVNEGIDTLVNKEYAQFFGYVLCTLGITGATAYVVFIFSLWRGMKKNHCAILILFMGLSLTSNLTTQQIYVLCCAAMWTVVLQDRRDIVSAEESNIHLIS